VSHYNPLVYFIGLGLHFQHILHALALLGLYFNAVFLLLYLFSQYQRLSQCFSTIETLQVMVVPGTATCGEITKTTYIQYPVIIVAFAPIHSYRHAHRRNWQANPREARNIYPMMPKQSVNREIPWAIPYQSAIPLAGKSRLLAPVQYQAAPCYIVYLIY
jgi:hypothetical protein